MTCYLRLHEVAVAISANPADRDRGTDWDEVGRRWQGADGVDGRDAALDAMPVTLIEMDDLPTTDLDGFVGLVLSGRSDQLLLETMADRISALLDSGGVVVFSGQLTHGWLPTGSSFERRPPGTGDGPPVLGDHPVFAGVEPADLGASFLYGGGWHRPPEGAEVIARHPDGTPGAHVARAGAGTVLLHGGANLMANATGTGSATRIVPQLVEWVAGATR